MADSMGQIFERFAQTKVLVLGDVMVDTYLWGASDRMSPEAPVPVVDIHRTEHRLGGAANVALNLAALGAEVILCSVTGNDDDAKLLELLLAENHLDSKHLLHSANRQTTVKTRVMSRDRQALRFDKETKDDLTNKEQDQLIAFVKDQLASHKIDVVIFQDYNKGVLTEKVIGGVMKLCTDRKIPTAVDPKKKNFFAYKGASLFKPNLKEVREAMDSDIDKSDLAGLKNTDFALRKDLNHAITLITLSEGGVFVADGEQGVIYSAMQRNISDVSGAGDTVISVAALALAQGLDKGMLAQFANIAGGLVCERVGVVPIDKALFLSECRRILKF